jgi:hypothetical protein
MIPKIFDKRNAVAKLINYVLGKTKHEHATDQCFYIPGTVLAPAPIKRNSTGGVEEINSQAIISEFKHCCSSSRTTKRMFHGLLSLPPGESLTEAQWDDALTIYMEKLGFGDDCAYFGCVHRDTSCEHMHIVACRVRQEDDYTLVSDKNDRYKAMEAARIIEEKLDISTPPTQSFAIDLSRAEYLYIRKALKNELNPDEENDKNMQHTLWRLKLATVIQKVLEAHHGQELTQFIQALNSSGVGVRVKFGEDDQPHGISYSYESRSIAGGDLSNTFKLPRLLSNEHGGLTYAASDYREVCLAGDQDKLRRDGKAPALQATPLSDMVELTNLVTEQSIVPNTPKPSAPVSSPVLPATSGDPALYFYMELDDEELADYTHDDWHGCPPHRVFQTERGFYAAEFVYTLPAKQASKAAVDIGFLEWLAQLLISALAAVFGITINWSVDQKRVPPNMIVSQDGNCKIKPVPEQFIVSASIQEQGNLQWKTEYDKAIGLVRHMGWKPNLDIIEFRVCCRLFESGMEKHEVLDQLKPNTHKVGNFGYIKETLEKAEDSVRNAPGGEKLISESVKPKHTSPEGPGM